MNIQQILRCIFVFSFLLTIAVGLYHMEYTPINVIFEDNTQNISAENSPTKWYKDKININTADINLLTTLQDIGEKTAKGIMEFRDKTGEFSNIDEIKKVSGIGDKTFEKIKEQICVK